MKKVLVALLIAAWMLSFRASSNKSPDNQVNKSAVTVDQELYKKQVAIATSAYIYSYPIVLMELLRRNSGEVPSNQFSHSTKSLSSKANPDLLTSKMWYDVRKSPLIIQSGDAKGRFFELSFKDLWSEVFATPGSALYMEGEQRLVLIPEGYRGELPPGYKVIVATTPIGELTAKVELKGIEDYEKAKAFQGTLTAMTLKEWQSKTIFAHKPAIPISQEEGISAFEQLEKMETQEYFTLLNRLLAVNRPKTSDWNLIEQMKLIGIDGERQFSINELGPQLQRAFSEAKVAALSLIKTYQHGVVENGWELSREHSGRFGNSYLARASYAWTENSSHLSTSYIEATSSVDYNGEPLNGSKEYTLRFAPNSLPPVHSFWSLSVYNTEGELVETQGGEPNLKSSQKMVFDKDGSLTVFLQPHRTTNKFLPNWLSTPRENFSVTLRMYAPTMALLNGEWMAPPIMKTPVEMLSE